jgi:hypothetical protein
VSKRRISIDEVVALAKSGYYDADAVDDLLAEAECPSTSTDVPKVTVGRSSERAARGRKRRKNDVRSARELKESFQNMEPKRSPK